MTGDTNGPYGQASPPYHGDPAQRADQGNPGAPPSYPYTVSHTHAGSRTYPNPNAFNPGDNRTVTFCTVTMCSMASVSGFSDPYQTPYLEPVPNDGIVAGEIIAWRGWTIVHNPLRLTSLSMSEYEWMPNTVMTGYVEDTGYGSAGVHAWKTIGQARSYAKSYSPQGVIGSVKLWGAIIEHEEGYRAENARIASLDEMINPEHRDQRVWWWRRRSQPLLDQLRTKYLVSR